MEIRTKFKVGDTVYVGYYNKNKKKYFIKEMKVYYITCYVEYDNTIKINYSIHDLQWGNNTDCVAEEYCFATKKSAQLWYGISDDNLLVEQSQKELENNE